MCIYESVCVCLGRVCQRALRLCSRGCTQHSSLDQTKMSLNTLINTLKMTMLSKISVFYVATCIRNSYIMYHQINVHEKQPKLVSALLSDSNICSINMQRRSAQYKSRSTMWSLTTPVVLNASRAIFNNTMQ